jgi:uncharacterized protein (TIRG00374 family)
LLKGKWGWLLRIAVTVVLFVVMFVFLVKPGELLTDLRQVVVGWLLAAAAIKAIGILSSILRWDQLLRGQGYHAPLGYLAGSFLVGRFFGMFLPSTLGLDGYRAYDMARRANDAAGSVAVIVVEKITGFFTLSLLVLVTLPAGLRFVPAPLLMAAFAIFCVPAILSFVLLLRPGIVERAMSWLLRRGFPGKARIEGLLRRAVSAVTAYRDQRGVLVRAVLLSLVVHGTTVLVYYFCARAISAQASLADMLFVGPWIILATVGLPTIGGEGAREFTSVGLLARIGVSESQAFLVGNLGFWVGEFIPVVIGGLILAFRPAHVVPQVRRTTEPPPAQD